jgi:hypothetical protein
MKTNFLTCGILALLCGAAPGFAGSVDSICDAVAGNLVSNCGFETGDFTDWTILNNDGNTAVEPNSFNPPGANSGEFFAALGDASSTPTTISQTFSDVAGSTLTFSFYLYTDGNPYSFTADWDGESLLSLGSAVTTTPEGYTDYSFTLTGTGSDTISFIEQDPLGFDGLDDVVVVDPPPSGVPEPTSLAFAAAALVAITFAHRRRTRKTA